MAKKKEEEKRGVYFIRLAMSIIIFAIGVWVVYDSHVSNNSYGLIVGLELIAGSYFVLKDKFKGFAKVSQ